MDPILTASRTQTFVSEQGTRRLLVEETDNNQLNMNFEIRQFQHPTGQEKYHCVHWQISVLKLLDGHHKHLAHKNTVLGGSPEVS